MENVKCKMENRELFSLLLFITCDIYTILNKKEYIGETL